MQLFSGQKLGEVGREQP